jgi:hypothetical protein
MKRLRHPVHSIREPFGKAGLIVACLALVAALGGTAFAAAKLNGTQKKEVEKIAKKFAGKPGATGPAGPAGAKGDAGAGGAAGAAGAAGPAGATGKEGKEGKEGKPWTAGGTLPRGSTETGSWSLSTEFEALTPVAVSFPIHLGSALGEENVFFIPSGGAETPAEEAACPGSAEAPEAAEGDFCAYARVVKANLALNNIGPSAGLPSEDGTSSSGAILWFTGLPGITEPEFAYGTWAVTEG